MNLAARHAGWMIALALVSGLGAGFVGGYGVRVVQVREATAAYNRRRAARPTVSSVYEARASHYARLPEGPRIVMLGDSLTSNGQWAEMLGPTVANRGIPGDTSQGILARLGGSVPDSAETVFLMIGVNDLMDHKLKPRAVAATTAAIVRRLAPRRVVLQSVLYTRRPDVNEQIRDLNARNRALCASGACTYVELNPAMAGRDGKPGLGRDGIHPNGEGYQRWAGVIRPLIEAWTVTGAGER